MNKNDFFSFEDDYQDFPMYNDGTFDSKNNLLTEGLMILLFVFLALGPVRFNNGNQQIIFFLVTLIPFLMLTKCDLSPYFKKLSLNDIRLIIVMYILGKIQYLITYFFLDLINFQTTSPTVTDLSAFTLFLNMFQIIGEEFFRISLFLLIMYLVYKYTKNRKTSIIISTVITLLIFGVLHINTYNNLIQILLFQGLGSIVELFGYIKTKNILVAIIIHILINLSNWVFLL